MIKSLYITLLAAVAYLLVGCGGANVLTPIEFDEVDYAPSHASGFAIYRDAEGNKLLSVTRPWQGENLAEQHLAIFSSEEAAKGYGGAYIVGRAERIVCMSTSYVAMLDELSMTESIVGVSGRQYVMCEEVRRSTKICDVGYDSNLDFEAMLIADADLVILYGVTAENSAITSKLRELEIPYIYFGDYTEQSPLGKAEWIVAMAEIVGCRERGEELFAGIVQRYDEARDALQHQSEPPKVMFNLPYQDVWYMPSDDSYLVRLVEDAGGEYIYRGKNPTSGSKGISLEEALALVADADVWLNVGQCLSLDEVRAAAPLFAGMDVVKRGAVYNNNRRRSEGGGSDFWESAIVRPDVVLRDLVRIMQGQSDSLYYHHKLE